MSPRAARAGARDRILAAAVRRIASEGIDGVRIARIAMDAGVSTALTCASQIPFSDVSVIA